MGSEAVKKCIRGADKYCDKNAVSYERDSQKDIFKTMSSKYERDFKAKVIDKARNTDEFCETVLKSLCRTDPDIVDDEFREPYERREKEAADRRERIKSLLYLTWSGFAFGFGGGVIAIGNVKSFNLPAVISGGVLIGLGVFLFVLIFYRPCC